LIKRGTSKAHISQDLLGHWTNIGQDLLGHWKHIAPTVVAISSLHLIPEWIVYTTQYLTMGSLAIIVFRAPLPSWVVSF
jgi:hypothetical protein